MKKFLKVVLITFSSLLFVLTLMLAALFFAIQQEDFQNRLKNIALPFLEQQLQTRVELERISIRYPDKIVLKGVIIEDLQRDTLFAMRELVMDLDMRRLFDLEVVVHHIGIEGLKAKVYRLPSNSYNFEFIAEAFASDQPAEPEPIDSTSSGIKIELNTLAVEDVRLTFSDDSLMHAELQWKSFHLQADEIDMVRQRYFFSSVQLNDAAIDIRMPDAEPIALGFNPGHIRLTGLNFNFQELQYQPDTIAAKLSSLSFREQSGLTLNNLSMAVRLEPKELSIHNFYLRTPHTKIQNETFLQFDSIGQLSSDLAAVTIATRIPESFIGMRDVLLFMPGLTPGEGIQMPPVLYADVHFQGTIDRFKAQMRVKSELAGFTATADMTSIDPDALAGRAVLNDLYFHSDSLNLALEFIELNATAGTTGKSMDVKLPFADLHMQGNYQLTGLGNVVNNLMVKHFNLTSAEYLPEGNQQLDLSLRVKNDSLLKPFLPDSMRFDPVDLQLAYSSTGKKLGINAEIPSVEMGALRLSGLRLEVLTLNDALSYTVNLTEIRQGELDVPPLELTGDLRNDVATFILLLRDTVNSEDNSVSGNVNLAGFKKPVLQPASGDSTVVTGRKMPPLNLALSIDRLALKSVEAFTADYIENSTGYFTGKVNIDDLMGDMKITGSLKTNDIAMKILMLDETFSMPSDELILQEEALVFDEFDIVDEKGEKLTIDGKVGFREFQDFRFDLAVRTDNFRALNSTSGTNDLFFGDLYLGLDLKIAGSLELPVVGGVLRVNENSKLTFIVPQTDPTLTDRTGIVEFVNPGQVTNQQLVINDSLKQSSISGMDVGVDIAIDKNAEVTMIIDKVTGDYVKLKGEGLLSGGIDPSGKVSLTGRYEFYEGIYELNVSLIQRKFAIRKGSYILFTGDPLSAQMNITAEYAISTAPLSLVESSIASSSQEMRNRYMQRLDFTTELRVSGELLEPLIGFDIVLDDEDIQVSPEVISTTRSRLAQLRTEPAELYKQVFALLLFNQFLAENPLMSQGGGSTELMIRQSAGRIITQQLNQLAGNLVKDFELEFDVDAIDDYSTGIRENRTDLNVALSKQFFGNRLKITVGSSFGLEGTPHENQSSSNIAGNFKADYLITRDGRYKLRAYRKNQYQMALLGEIVETGLTFIITMDYDTWNEITGKQ